VENNASVGQPQLDPDEFTNVKIYTGFKYDVIMSGDSKAVSPEIPNKKQLAFRTGEWNLNDDEDFLTFEERMEALYKKDRDKVLVIYDFKLVIDKIKELQAFLDKDEEVIKESVAIKLQGTFIETLGFEPTIRNIFRIFTIHAEIFMECLKEVSEKAESDPNGLRRVQLEGLKDDFDIHKDDTDSGGSLPSKIYPWPLYRKVSISKVKNKTYEEAWLGADVNIPQNVPELVFVEELLKGLLEVAKEDIDRQTRLDNPDTIIDSWFPVNPLDTPLYGVIQNPYKTASIGDSNNVLDPIKLMGMRAFTFLGASNRLPRVEEITVMGTLEANTCYEGVKNDVVRKAMMDVSEDDAVIRDKIIAAFIDGTDGDNQITIEPAPKVSRPIMYKSGNKYYYKYISDNDNGGAGQKFIPFNGNFDGKEFYNTDSTPKSTSTLRKSSYLDVPNGGLFLGTKQGNNSVQPGAMMFKIFSEEAYGIGTKGLRPDYPNQVDSIKLMIHNLKKVNGDTPLLNSGTLYEAKITGSEGLKVSDTVRPIDGWNILGDDTSKYAFTTVKYVNITPNENNIEKIARVGETDEGDNTYTVPTNGIKGAPIISMFYVDMVCEYGATSLSKPLTITPEFTDSEIFPLNGEKYYPVRVGGARKFSVAKQATKTPKLGKNRELFNQEGTYIPHVDFMSNNMAYSNTYTHWSLFGSQLYFEQRQSSSPISARAFLFLHTLPWNQLFTDNAYKDGWNAGIFENDEGHTIANLFNRKAAFIHAPYLWCAFIGGLLWRYNEDDIIYEDGDDDLTKGKVPTYKGGSGSYDPIIWGKKVNQNWTKSNFKPCYVPEYENDNSWKNNTLVETGYKRLPDRDQFLTGWVGDAPTSYETDGDFKYIDNTLRKLPTQIKREFRKIFFDFVNSGEWKAIRDEFEIHGKDGSNGYSLAGLNNNWDESDVGSPATKYHTNGWAEGSFNDGSASWESRWRDCAHIVTPDKTSAADNLAWAPYVAAIRSRSGSVKNNMNAAAAKPASGGITGIKVNNAKQFRNFENLEYLVPIRTRAVLNGTSGSDFVKDSVFNGEPQYEQSNEYNYDLGHRDGTANQIMVTMFKKGVWISNNSYKPWVVEKLTLTNGTVYFDDSKQAGLLDEFDCTHDELSLYIMSFVAEWKRLNTLDPKKTEEDNLKQQIFNTMDNDTIRLNIYRHCKSLYDKWIAGSKGNIMTACGAGSGLVTKANLSRSRKEGSASRLIDSFRFTNRAFNDLGDEYLLNPKIITDTVLGNPNQSFYDLISRTLADNNFNFIALPAYIDYHSETEMEALFKPEIYNDDLDKAVSGPTFVCVYVGQSSNKLDLGKGSAFPNDGFDFKVDDEGNLAMGNEGLPKDFTKEKLSHEQYP
jgi:hypothetical protein